MPPSEPPGAHSGGHPGERPGERLDRALAAIDRAVAAAPERDGASLSEAVREVSAVRDAVAAQGREAPEVRHRLDGLNAVLSMILAVHFPLGAPPWDEARKARGWLAEIRAAS